MFAVYSKGGLNYRSTIDNLYSVSNIDNIARVRNNTKEGLPKDFSIKEEKKDYKTKITKEAESVYKKYANIDVSEPIFSVEQVMSFNLIKIDNTDSILDAYKLMSENHIEQLPVYNTETNMLMGMVDYKTILDVIVGDIEYTDHTLSRQVDSLLLEDIITTDPITDIRRVAKVMIDFNLNALPVVSENNDILGIVTKTDIIKAVSNNPHFKLWG